MWPWEKEMIILKTMGVGDYLRFSWAGHILSINLPKLFGNRCKRNRYPELCCVHPNWDICQRAVWSQIMEAGTNPQNDLFLMWIREAVISKTLCFELSFYTLTRKCLSVVCSKAIKLEGILKRQDWRFTLHSDCILPVNKVLKMSIYPINIAQDFCFLLR